MQVRVYVNGHEVSDRVIADQLSIRNELSNWQCTASLLVRGKEAFGDTFPLTLPFALATLVSMANRATIRITDLDDNTLFGGYIVSTNYSHLVRDEAHYAVTCESWQALLNAYIVSVSYDEEVTDKEIIEDIIGTYVPDFDVTNVQAVNTYSAYVAENKSVWAILTELASMAGAEVWANGDKEIFFDQDPYDSAPVDISDTPTVGQIDVMDLAYAEDSKEMANRVTVIGGADLITGDPVLAVADDEASQAAYGYVFPYTIADGSIVIQALAEVLAEAELGRRSQPKRTGSFVVNTPGFAVGQVVHITNQRFDLSNQEFLIRSVEMRWTGPQDVVYTVTFGDKIPTLVDALRGISQTASSGNAPRPAYIPAGGISGDQLAAGVINSLTKYGPLLRPIVTVSSLPSLPDSEFPGDSYVFLTTDNKIYKNNAGTWEESTAPVGSYITHHVGTFLAGNMVGAIISDQIDSVAIEKMYGTISAGGSISINAGAITEGTFPGTVYISGSSISGGTIGGTVVISASNVSGEFTGTVSLDGAKIKSLSIDSGQLKDGSVGDAKIANVNIGKLTAGNVAFGSATTIGYNSDYKLSLQSNAVRIEASSSRYVQITSGGATLQYDTDNVVTLTGSALTIVSGGGQKLQATSSGVTIQADANRKITVGDSSGNITIEHNSSRAEISSTGVLFEASATVYAMYTSGGLYMQAGSSQVNLQPAGLQMNAGQIGLGASSFASSPVQISASGIELALSNSSFGVSSGGISAAIQATYSFTWNALAGFSFSGPLGAVGYPVFASEYRVSGTKIVGAQQSAVADATGAGDVVARLNDLLARLRTHGLIAT